MENKDRQKVNFFEGIVRLRFLIGLFLIFFIVLTTGLIVGRCGDSMDKAITGMKDIGAGFAKENITNTFISSLPEIRSTNGDILEVAQYRATEIFNRRDSKSIMWGALPLGENVVEIRVPATYRYHIRLSDTWKLDVSGNTCIVYAPSVRPSQPPAIHTDKMEKLVLKQGWARFDAYRMLERLESDITPELEKRAASATYQSLVAESARQSVAEFVRNWLLKNSQWEQTKFNTIKVIFPYETYKIQNPAEARPTIKIGQG